MPDGAGGSHPDPEEIERKLRKLTEEIGKPRIHEPSALERMAAARQAEKQRKQFLGGLRTTALDKQGDEENTRTWVTSFAPGSTKFVTTTVKAHGTMSAGTATVSGIKVLRIKVDFLFVYVIEPPGKPADWMRVVQQRYGNVDFAQWDDPGGRLEPWDSTGGGAAGRPVRCARRVHPPRLRARAAGQRQGIGAAGRPVFHGHPASASADVGCRATTGT